MADAGGGSSSGRCRVCSLELRGSQRRWIFGGESATGRPALRVILGHLLGQEMVRGDGRGEFACGKCAFSLERVYRYDGVMNRVKALSIERMQKLATERDKLAQCVLFQYGRSNPGDARPDGALLGPSLHVTRVQYNELLQDDAAFSEYESWSERGSDLDRGGAGSACSYSFSASTPRRQSATGDRGPRGPAPGSGRSTPSCGGAAGAMRRSASVGSLRVPDAQYESVCKVPRRLAAAGLGGARSPWSVSRSVSVGEGGGAGDGARGGGGVARRYRAAAGPGSVGRRGWGAGASSLGSSVSLASAGIAEEEEDERDDALDSVSVFSELAASPVSPPPPPALARSLQLVRSIGVRGLSTPKGSGIPTPARGGRRGEGSQRSTPRGSPSKTPESPDAGGHDGGEKRSASREDLRQQLEQMKRQLALKEREEARSRSLERSLARAAAGQRQRDRFLEECARMIEETQGDGGDLHDLVGRVKTRLSEARSAPTTSDPDDDSSDLHTHGAEPREGRDGKDERDEKDERDLRERGDEIERERRDERDGKERRDDKELLHLREALEEKDSDIRRLCSVLSSNESTISSLDTLLKQKDQELKRTSDAFLEMMEAERRSHTRGLQKRDALLAETEQLLQSRLRDTEELLRSRPSGVVLDGALAEASERCVEQQRQLQQALGDRVQVLSEHREEVERLHRLVEDKERRLKEKMEASSTTEAELRAEMERLKRGATQERPRGGRDHGGVDAKLAAENAALKAQLGQQEKLLSELTGEGRTNGGRGHYGATAQRLLLSGDDDDDVDDDLLPEFPQFVTRSPPLESTPGDPGGSRPPAAALSNGLETKKTVGSDDDGGRQESPVTPVSPSPSPAPATQQRAPAKLGSAKKRAVAAAVAGGAAARQNGKKAAARTDK